MLEPSVVGRARLLPSRHAIGKRRLSRSFALPTSILLVNLRRHSVHKKQAEVGTVVDQSAIHLHVGGS